jgi:hypothetical protein
VRQMTSRARHRIHEERPRFAIDRKAAAAAADRLIAALRDADIDALRAVLATDVVQIADGGDRVNAGITPIVGIDRVSQLLIGLRRKHWAGLELRRADVNDLPGVLLLWPDGTIFAAVGLDFDGDRIAALFAVLNPDKLVHANRR